MRVFATQAMWDKVEEQWYEVYAVDGETVEQEEYFREVEVEQCLENDEVDEYCTCCNCPTNEDCKDFNCTCGECEEEVENGNMDDLVIECDCPGLCCNERRRT